MKFFKKIFIYLRSLFEGNIAIVVVSGTNIIDVEQRSTLYIKSGYKVLELMKVKFNFSLMQWVYQVTLYKDDTK